MAEISREEYISRLDTMRNSMSVCLATWNGFNDNFQIMKSMCDQAISDMEKLEKIEQIVDNSTFHPNNYMSSVELLKIIKEIEQIVKEVE